MERRLAAILAADVVGYSRLMEADEAGTFARLKTLRKELAQPEIAGGRDRDERSRPRSAPTARRPRGRARETMW